MGTRLGLSTHIWPCHMFPRSAIGGRSRRCAGSQGNPQVDHQVAAGAARCSRSFFEGVRKAGLPEESALDRLRLNEGARYRPALGPQRKSRTSAYAPTPDISLRRTAGRRAADPRRGPAHRRQHRQAAGAATALVKRWALIHINALSPVVQGNNDTEGTGRSLGEWSITRMTGLRHLNLRRTQVSDVSSLAKLTSLRQLDVTQSKVTNAADLLQHLPRLTIIGRPQREER